jgi:oligopeptide/dipeptide ABC transporter ATP-binding protein
MLEDKLLLSVKDLVTAFDTDAGRVTAVDGVSFDLQAGKTLGVVGESGCGKSVTAMSIMQLLPRPMGQIIGGSIHFNGEDLVMASEERMGSIRGKEIGVIFQEPMTALNPVHRIGQQLSESLLLHEGLSKKEAWSRSIEILKLVGIPSPEVRVSEYPHQLSGGMRQRVVIAIALACRPSLVIADEPTTALDVTVQAQILELIQSLQEEMGLSVMMITHDLGVIAETCDDVVVMYAGRVAEKGNTQQIFENPQHLYTLGLLNSIPKLGTPRKQRLNTIDGYVPGLDEMPVGARFAPRSQHPRVAEYLASEDFKTVKPGLVEVEPGHWVEDCAYVRAF